MADLRVPALIHMAMSGLLVAVVAVLVGASCADPIVGVGAGATILAVCGAMVEVWRRDRESQRAVVLAALRLPQELGPIEDPRWDPALMLIDRISVDSPGLAERVRGALMRELRALQRLQELVEADQRLTLEASGLAEVVEVRQTRVDDLLASLQSLALAVELDAACAPLPEQEAMADAVAARAASVEVSSRIAPGARQRAAHTARARGALRA
ncbi:MAG TPA: hypothetical protein ENK18_05620 [Deltaproteobacteria bacterium]|nr:hypothetical protein [Deltaproteobacteria bacterium]